MAHGLNERLYLDLSNSLRRVATSFIAHDDRLLTRGVVDASVLSLELVFRDLLFKDSVEGLNAMESACELVRRSLQLLHCKYNLPGEPHQFSW